MCLLPVGACGPALPRASTRQRQNGAWMPTSLLSPKQAGQKEPAPFQGTRSGISACRRSTFRDATSRAATRSRSSQTGAVPAARAPAGPVDFGAAQKQAGSFPVTAEAGRLPRLPRAARRLLLDRGARDYGTTRVPAHQASERGLIIPRQISDALPGVESDGGDRRAHIGNRPHKSRTMSRLSTPPAAKSPT